MDASDPHHCAQDAETSVVNAIESIDSQYENEVKGARAAQHRPDSEAGAWAKVKEFRAQYPGFVLGAVALGVGIPSARCELPTLYLWN